MAWRPVFSSDVRRARWRQLAESIHTESPSALRSQPLLVFSLGSKQGDYRLPLQGSVSNHVGVPCFVTLGFVSLRGVTGVGGVWRSESQRELSETPREDSVRESSPDSRSLFSKDCRIRVRGVWTFLSVSLAAPPRGCLEAVSFWAETGTGLESPCPSRPRVTKTSRPLSRTPCSGAQEARAGPAWLSGVEDVAFCRTSVRISESIFDDSIPPCPRFPPPLLCIVDGRRVGAV